MRFIYIIDTAVRFLHLAREYILRMIIMVHQGPYLLKFQLELAPMVQLYTLDTLELVESPMEPPFSMSMVLQPCKPKDKSTAKGIATDKDGKAAKGRVVV